MANGVTEGRLAGSVLRAGRRALGAVRRLLPNAEADPAPSRRPSLLPSLYQASRLRVVRLEAASYPESGEAALRRKIERYQQLANQRRPGRVPAYRELARLESLRGNDLVAAAYWLRAMRLAGEDRYGDLDWVTKTLAAQGYPAEAEAAAAMFGPADAAATRCYELLRDAYARCRPAPPSVEFEAFEDRRGAGLVRVSVVVSLYRAAAKLPTFLEALRRQTLLRQGRAEFIFVDSGSPDDEYDALSRSRGDPPPPYLYVRTRRRETIQTAWNRGIGLARAPYLCFLGADEAVTPPALELLADRLDADPALDWVQANSVVTEVDAGGAFVRDLMTYNRSEYTPLHPYLDTSYLSWVGALYRRSIHDRFGYYDGSFGAAGDTEFKNRVLPHLKTACVPQTLGVFLNYPEERATATPRAEIEDLRAWHLHRTVGGVRYAFENRDPAEAGRAVLLALRHRKCHAAGRSSDAGYARVLADDLARRDPSSPVLDLAPGLAALDDAYRALDLAEAGNVVGLARSLRRARRAVAQAQADHRATPWLPDATYETFNDARREQHCGFW